MFLLIVDKQYAHLFLNSVYQEDCGQQDSAPDELAHRSTDLDDLDDLDFELEDQGGEGVVVDGLAPVPQYLSRSLSRLSKMDSHRVGNTAFCQMNV